MTPPVGLVTARTLRGSADQPVRRPAADGSRPGLRRHHDPRGGDAGQPPRAGRPISRPSSRATAGLRAGERPRTRANTVRAETIAINAAHFGMPDAEGALPQGGGRFDTAGVPTPVARPGTPPPSSPPSRTRACRRASRSTPAPTSAISRSSPISAPSIPAFLRIPACALHPRAGGLDDAPPAQWGRMPRRARFDQPSMAFETQRKALDATLDAHALQARRGP